MSEKLEFELAVKNNQLDPALDKASKKSGDLQDALNTALGVFGGGVALKGFDFLTDKIGDAIDFAKQSVEAFTQQEDALNRLGQSVRATGDFSQQSVDDLADFADQLGRTSKQSGEAIINQLAFAKSLGQSNDATKEMVQAAANLSATFGGSLESNVALLGKTLTGTTGKLAAYIPELKNLTKEQLAAGDAAEIINQKFSGAAASELDSYSGRIHALANAYEDIQKQIGGFIADSDLVKTSQGALTTILNDVTQAISDWRIEMDRQNGTLKENESSLDQLRRKYVELQADAAAAQDVVDNPSFFDKLLARPLAAAENLKLLNEEIRQTGLLISQTQSDLNSTTAAAAPSAPRIPQEVLDSRAKLNNEILLLDQQLVLDQNNLDIERANTQIQNDLDRQTAEIQRMTDYAATKAELEFQLKEAEIVRLQEGEDRKLELQKLYGEKELALTKIRNDGIIKASNLQRDAEKKAATERIALQQATASTITGIVGAAANLSVLFTKDGSREQFYIQKAAALAQAIVATNLAMAMANAVPPPGNIPAIAAARANGAIAISGIVASTIKGFADGGVIGGETGATPGRDNVTVNARKGEMYLNAEQQATLFNWISNGTIVGGGGDTTIVCDGDVLFKIIRNRVKQGYKLA